ncbi:MAG TPA: hypothetical protein VHY91_26685 [Pirellulales bacterium]|jgi:FkbH-like protein|nr:hypothetical protein [Pirellulales bacterium]
MDSVKLVIWDLDGVFWGGTLSEEGIALRPENHELVRELWRRGIMSSICSKNDHEQVRAVLTREQLWDQFVFAKIAWRPKGEMIAQTIGEMNLRAVNVLFIDDNPQNLEEAKFFNPGLQVAGPEVLAQLLDWPQAKGKADASLSRWRQYRQLEQKVIDQTQFSADSNEDFLRQCNIRVTIRRDCDAQFDRLLEMIQRTNQLNFTKQRLDADSLRAALADPALECAYLSVVDRYGDYGIAGFYALREQRLEHYLFSCRILNMGVEAWLYDRLGRPQLDVVGETSDDPRRLPVPDWIALEGAAPAGACAAASTAADHASASAESNGAQATPDTAWPLTIFKGGCDLEQMVDFLGRPGRIDREFNYKNALGAPVHCEHTEILRRCGPETHERFGDVIDRIEFLDRRALTTRMFDDRYEVVVYSTLMDMCNGLYRRRDTDLVVSFGDFLQDVTRPAAWPALLAHDPWMSQGFLDWFSQNFEFLGGQSVEGFRRNLHWLAERIAPPRQLVLLNGAEVDVENEREPDRWRHHARMNAAIDEVAKAYRHVDVCDVRLAVRGREQLVDNIRHYRRGVHFQLARQIEQLVADRHALSTNPMTTWLNAGKTVVREALWQAKHRLLGRSSASQKRPR